MKASRNFEIDQCMDYMSYRASLGVNAKVDAQAVASLNPYAGFSMQA